MDSPSPAQGRAGLFRLRVVEGVGLAAQELGFTIVAGTYGPDPANPAGFIAHVPEPPAPMQAELDPILHPERRLECDRLPATPDEGIMDGFARSLGASAPRRCWRCEEPSAWQCFVKLQLGGQDVVWAAFFHCRDHRPGDLPVVLNGVTMDVVKRPDSPAWATIQETTRPPTEGDDG